MDKKVDKKVDKPARQKSAVKRGGGHTRSTGKTTVKEKKRSESHKKK